MQAQTKLASNQSRIFRAGASTSNITPPLGSPIVGGFTEPLATNIHDELHVRSLALDDGTTKLVFVVVDNVGVDQAVFDEAKHLIHEKTGLPKKHLMMSAVHDHSAVSADGLGTERRNWHLGKPLDEYGTFLASRISDGVRVALNRLEPARIGWGVGSLPQHLFNRRWVMKDSVPNPFGGMDKVKTFPGFRNPNSVKPAGPIDPEVSFISVQSTSGRPIALLANYSLHYVGGVPKGDISADYFAVFADRIQELLKADRQDPPFVGILTNGTSGDVTNVNYSDKRDGHPPYVKMRIVADDLAKEVLRVYKGIHHHDWVKLQAAQSELNLKVRRASPEMLVHTWKVLLRPDKYSSQVNAYANRILHLEKEWPDSINIPLQVFRIGDLGVAAVPFEVFTQTGLNIKKESPFKPTFTIELANGEYYYLPTPEQHKLGGYETWLSTNMVETDASLKITAGLMELFSKLNDH